MSKDYAQALHQFWSSFEWPAYDSTTVPGKDSNPGDKRITYNVVQDEFLSDVSMAVSLWDRSYSWEDISKKSDEIYDAIGLGGVMLTYDDGHIWIRRGHPFAQRMSDTDDAIRRIYLSIEAEYITGR